MKRIIGNLLATAIISISAQAQDTKDVSWTSDQIRVIQKAYSMGKEFDLGYTLAAISIVESDAGKYKINLSDPSCGVFHNNIRSVMNRHSDVKDTSYNRNRMCSMLIDDIEFAGTEALSELKYWYGVRKGVWSTTIMSYNAGWKYENGEGYKTKIVKWVKYLKLNRESLEIKDNKYYHLTNSTK